MDSNWNGSRFKPDVGTGFYESYFQRANHPDRPLAFWIRYTIFKPQSPLGSPRGELWAIYFNGETFENVAVKESFPISECSFSTTSLNVRIGGSTLTDGSVAGCTTMSSKKVEWSLDYAGHHIPLLLLPESWYERELPRAKALVGTPNAIYNGTLTVCGETIPIEGWQGSQNHNWGERHTDSYAWGQVAGFDNAPETFLECSTAQLKLGPIWTPRLTFLVLRDKGEEIVFNGILRAVRARGSFDFFSWTFDTSDARTRVRGRIHAPANAFVGLTYDNPPGGQKICLNSKLAAAEIEVFRRGRRPRALTTEKRAAFEILTDRSDHGIPVVI
jgi:hypothetical protein